MTAEQKTAGRDLSSNSVIDRRYVIRDTFNPDKNGVTYQVYDTVMGRPAKLRRLFSLSDIHDPLSAYRQYERRSRFLNTYRKLSELAVSSLPTVYTFRLEGMGAYAVYADVSAVTLSEYIACGGNRSYEEAKGLLMPVAVALKMLHDGGVCHGNVSAASVRMQGKTAVLCDATGDALSAEEDMKQLLMVMLLVMYGQEFHDVSQTGALPLPEELKKCLEKAFSEETHLTDDELLLTVFQCREIALGAAKAEMPPPKDILDLAQAYGTPVARLITSLT